MRTLAPAKSSTASASSNLSSAHRHDRSFARATFRTPEQEKTRVALAVDGTSPHVLVSEDWYRLSPNQKIYVGCSVYLQSPYLKQQECMQRRWLLTHRTAAHWCCSSAAIIIVGVPAYKLPMSIVRSVLKGVHVPGSSTLAPSVHVPSVI